MDEEYESPGQEALEYSSNFRSQNWMSVKGDMLKLSYSPPKVSALEYFVGIHFKLQLKTLKSLYRVGFYDFFT